MGATIRAKWCRIRDGFTPADGPPPHAAKNKAPACAGALCRVGCKGGAPTGKPVQRTRVRFVVWLCPSTVSRAR